MKTRKGTALIVVLIMLLTVLALAYIISEVVTNQSTITRHNVDRSRAYYAALAGVNLAIDGLRFRNWGTNTYTLCRSGCDVNDGDIPYLVTITIGNPGVASIDPQCRRITAYVNYEFSPTD